MDSGRAAVTHARMVQEVRPDGPVSLGQRLPLLLRGLLLGRPLTSRPCLLVQLTADQPLARRGGPRAPGPPQPLTAPQGYTESTAWFSAAWRSLRSTSVRPSAPGIWAAIWASQPLSSSTCFSIGSTPRPRASTLAVVPEPA
jgi:hypothetical protein